MRAIRNYNYINYYGDYTEKDITIRPAKHTKGAFLISEHIKFQHYHMESVNGVSGYSVYQWIGTIRHAYKRAW